MGVLGPPFVIAWGAGSFRITAVGVGQTRGRQLVDRNIVPCLRTPRGKLIFRRAQVEVIAVDNARPGTPTMVHRFAAHNMGPQAGSKRAQRRILGRRPDLGDELPINPSTWRVERVSCHEAAGQRCLRRLPCRHPLCGLGSAVTGGRGRTGRTRGATAAVRLGVPSVLVTCREPEPAEPLRGAHGQRAGHLQDDREREHGPLHVGSAG